MKRYFLIMALIASCVYLTGCEMAAPGANVPSLKISGDYAGCGAGAFIRDGFPDSFIISSYEATIAKDVAVVMWFSDFTLPFPAATCEAVNGHGAIPMITWMPCMWSDDNDTTYSLDNILAGNCDTYIEQYANSVAAWGKPLFIRLGHEMNGSWYLWSGSRNGSDEAAVAKYRDSWRYIYNKFVSAEADNVTWVWCPNFEDWPIAGWNTPEAYYPGDQYVDWVAFDGYSRPGNGFKTFDQVSSNIYSIITNLCDKPVAIGEMSSATQEPVDGKPAWITDAFDKIRLDYPEIKLYIWLNQSKVEYDGYCDWKVDSSGASKTAFRSAMTYDHYISTIH